MSIAPDGVKVVRTDVNGAYIFDEAHQQWRQLITASSMPEAAALKEPFSTGVYEIAIAPSDSDILYMVFKGAVYRSDDQGAHWSKTALSGLAANGNDAARLDGQKMAIDPLNADVVLVGSQDKGLFITRDGGATWKPVADLAPPGKDASNISHGVAGIVFDPTGGKDHSLLAYASSYNNGVYVTSDGGETWRQAAGGPVNVLHAAVSQSGVYYAVGDNGKAIWAYDDGVWTKLLSASGIRNIAVDPFDDNHLVMSISSGGLRESFNGGQTWSGAPGWTTDAAPGEVGWIAEIPGWLSTGELVFDPTEENKLWLAAGAGAWTADISLPMQSAYKKIVGSQIEWQSVSAGLEELCANDIVVSKSGHPVLASWDFAFFYIEDPDHYQQEYEIPGGGGKSGFSAGWSLDYASSDRDFIVGLSNWWGKQTSGYSTDGGQTWNTFEATPANVSIGGSIAASTPDNFIWAAANKKPAYYTLDGGKSWNEIVLPDMANWNSFHWAYYLNRTTVAADRVDPNTFYLYYGVGKTGGVYRSTDGGASWDKMFSGALHPFSTFNASIQTAPDHAGHLFFTGGAQDGVGSAGYGFYHSVDGGAHWSKIAGVSEVSAFGFGAAAGAGGYPAIYIAGYVDNVYGVWQSDNEGKSWTNLGAFPDGNVLHVTTISGDPEIYGQVYVGFGGGGYSYLPGKSASGAAPGEPAGDDGADPGAIIATLSGGDAADTLTGSLNDELIDGHGGDDRIAGGGGRDRIDGGPGTDTAVFAGAKADYTLSHGDAGAIIVSGPRGQRAELIAIEFLQFGDGSLISVNGAQIIPGPASPNRADNSASHVGPAMWGQRLPYDAGVDRLIGIDAGGAISHPQPDFAGRGSLHREIAIDLMEMSDFPRAIDHSVANTPAFG